MQNEVQVRAGGKPPVLVRVSNLKTHFPVKRGLLKRVVGYVKAVDGVSFEVREHQTLGLVGESGCGKSTVGRTLLRLIPATQGTVTFGGRDVLTMPSGELQAMRRQMQIIFQDPVGSLNPRMTVGKIIGEPILVHKLATKEELPGRVAELMQKVGLSPEYANRYPHEFSGGQRQRIGIARALGLKPRFIVCDEPVSALDVSIQSQILNLLADLQDEFALSYLFIAHNLAVVEHFCDRIAVMYLGKIVEIADRVDLYKRPAHPYTQALLSAAPTPDPMNTARRIILPGEVPSPINPPSGCAFHPRCLLSRELAKKAGVGETVRLTIGGAPVDLMKKCVESAPVLETVGADESHCAACWFKG